MTAATDAAPALASSIATVDRLIGWCSFRLGPAGVSPVPAHRALAAGDWVRCADALADPEFFPTWHRLLAARMAGECGRVPAVTPPGYVKSWYARLFGFLGGTLFHLTRRVPVLSPENIAFQAHPEWRKPIAVALLDGRFVCLPDDPASGAAEATVVPAERALAAVLRSRVAAHGTRFVAAFQPSARFGRHSLWGAVTDALDTGMWYAGKERGQPAAGAADAALVLPARIPPFTAGSTVRRLPGVDGGQHWTRERQSCCFHHKLPGVERPCVTCPRLSDEQRSQILGA